MTSMQEDIFKCVLSGDLEAVKRHFEREGATEEQQGGDLFGLKDEGGRGALLNAAMLGTSAIVRELLRNGAQVDEQTVRGYSSLHLAACWGHLETVRTLLELGADTQTKTFRGERPVDLARRYSKTDCAECLVLAEAKQDLVSYVAFVRNLITDPKMKLKKGEKNLCKRVCSDKSEWIHGVKSPTVSHFMAQRKDMEDTLQAILSKLSTQCKCKCY